MCYNIADKGVKLPVRRMRPSGMPGGVFLSRLRVRSLRRFPNTIFRRIQYETYL